MSEWRGRTCLPFTPALPFPFTHGPRPLQLPLLLLQTMQGTPLLASKGSRGPRRPQHKLHSCVWALSIWASNTVHWWGSPAHSPAPTPRRLCSWATTNLSGTGLSKAFEATRGLFRPPAPWDSARSLTSRLRPGWAPPLVSLGGFSQV